MSGCSNNAKQETWKNEILETEKEFMEAAATDGIPQAFSAYAAEDVVIIRGDFLIEGRKALQIYYENQYPAYEKHELKWEPDFVDVSSSGDLGYTYGKFHHTITDSLGYTRSVDGIFHTVWKRQADGTWKFVWD